MGTSAPDKKEEKKQAAKAPVITSGTAPVVVDHEGNQTLESGSAFVDVPVNDKLVLRCFGLVRKDKINMHQVQLSNSVKASVLAALAQLQK